MKKGKFELSRFNFGRITAIISAVVFSVMGILTIAPVTRTYADENAQELSVDIDTTISVYIPDEKMTFQFVADGLNTKTKNIGVQIATNSTAGYELYFSSSDEETDLVNKKTQEKIPSVEKTFIGTIADMQNNTWGYVDSNEKVQSIPKKSDPIVVLDSHSMPENGTIEATVKFVTKIDENLTPGKYTKDVIFTALAHEQKVNLFDITNMQQMNSTVCYNTPTPSIEATEYTDKYEINPMKVPTKELIDTRDGKTYRVSKLADGNCWMTQNLSYELSTNKSLNLVSSDLTTYAKWTPERDSQHEQGIVWGSSVDRTNSFLDTDGEMYYNWVAATAGHKTEIVSANSEDSVCPHGWKLPVSAGDKSYSGLFGTYGELATENTLFKAPFNFTTTGMYRFGAPSTVGGKPGENNYDAGGQAWYWTGSGTSANNQAYALNIGAPDDVYPGFDTARWTIKAHGLSIRCVAR